MRTIDEIIIHCLATPEGWARGKSNEAKLSYVRDWHVKGRGWSDIGYNFVLFGDGETLIGRDRDHDGDTFEEIGAHTRGRNRSTLGVALEGGFGSSEHDSFLDHFTSEQEEALLKLLTQWVRMFPTIDKVSGHNQYAAKACPGFNVPLWLRSKGWAIEGARNSRPSTTRAMVESAPVLRPKGLLRRGDRGWWVGRLQDLLGVRGPDVFGPKTERAVRLFQRAKGLSVDGIVGPNTWRALVG